MLGVAERRRDGDATAAAVGTRHRVLCFRIFAQARYHRLGSPVERVLEILAMLRRHMPGKLDRENLSYIVECIVSDKLYTVQFSTSAKGASDGVSADMERFLGRHGATKGQGAAARVLSLSFFFSLSVSLSLSRSLAPPSLAPSLSPSFPPSLPPSLSLYI